MDASDISPRLRLVRDVCARLNVADSSKMVVVWSSTSDVRPPMTPASATASLGVAITVMSDVSTRSVPSSVVNSSPSRAGRTMTSTMPSSPTSVS